MQAAQSRYGTTFDGRAVTLFTLENSHGVRVTVIDLGATVTSVMVPDRSGKTANVSLGFDSLAGWEKNVSFFGCIVGRVANRIRGGRFDLDGKQYTLARNTGENHLHGGLKGFDKAVWKGKLFKKGDSAGIRFRHTSPDGDEGYPGTLNATAEYALNEENELSFEYWATADKATPVNLTNHAYWNLAGAGSGTILSHEAKLNCPFYLPVDTGAIPPGKSSGPPAARSTFPITRRSAATSRACPADTITTWSSGNGEETSTWSALSGTLTAAAPWRCTPRCPACSSTRPTSSTARHSRSTAASAWRPSGSPTA